MSGIGKTHFSKQLARDHFTCFCCDDLIEVKLEDELKHLGYKGIHDVALWLGQPYDTCYAQNSGKYLQFEQEVLDDVLDQIENKGLQNVVIDTTGSVIYLNAATLNRLKRLTKVIYFSAEKNVMDKMYEQYLHHPKPVIWGDQFQMLDNETPRQALARCYLNLLTSRSQQYANLADITLDYTVARNPKFSITKWLSTLEQ